MFNSNNICNISEYLFRWSTWDNKMSGLFSDLDRNKKELDKIFSHYPTKDMEKRQEHKEILDGVYTLMRNFDNNKICHFLHNFDSKVNQVFALKTARLSYLTNCFSFSMDNLMELIIFYVYIAETRFNSIFFNPSSLTESISFLKESLGRWQKINVCLCDLKKEWKTNREKNTHNREFTQLIKDNVLDFRESVLEARAKMEISFWDINTYPHAKGGDNVY